MISRHAPARGFSLLEVMVAMTITALIMIGALSALDNTRRITRKGMSLSQAQETATYSLHELADGVKPAGFMIGKSNAIIASSGTTAGVVRPTAWDNFDPSNTQLMAGIWAYIPSGGRAFRPVAGTDGITVRFSNGSPPIHVCAMPGANAARMEFAWNPAYADAYPGTDADVQLITTNTCGSTGINGQVNIYDVHINNSPVGAPNGNCSCTGGNCNPAATQSCVAVDPLCANLYNNRFDSCYQITFTNNLNCDFCQVGPTYMIVAKTRTYWISTEDATGVIYSAPGVVSSRPVLVGRDSLSGVTRIYANDVEDLQIDYLMDPSDSATGAIGAVSVNGQMPELPGSLVFNVLPADAGTRQRYVEALAAVRAVRLNLSVRTSAVDLTYRSNAYCTTGGGMANLQGMFSRPALSNRPAATASNYDFCDGFRRHVVTQTLFLPNMLAKVS